MTESEPLTGQSVWDPIGDWIITPCHRCRWLPELHAGPCLPVEGGAE